MILTTNLRFILHGHDGDLMNYKNIFKTTSAWILKSPEAAPAIALPVGEITDCVRSRDILVPRLSVGGHQEPGYETTLFNVCLAECAFCRNGLPAWAQATQNQQQCLAG